LSGGISIGAAKLTEHTGTFGEDGVTIAVAKFEVSLAKFEYLVLGEWVYIVMQLSLLASRYTAIIIVIVIVIITVVCFIFWCHNQVEIQVECRSIKLHPAAHPWRTYKLS
jgi:hypothetical protein